MTSDDVRQNGWHPVVLTPATRIYEFDAGSRRVRPDIREWFEDHGVPPCDVAFEWKFLPSSATAWFKDSHLAMLFKLVHG